MLLKDSPFQGLSAYSLMGAIVKMQASYLSAKML